MPHEFANVLKLRILGNFKKILEVPGIKTLTVVSKNRKKNRKKKQRKNADLKHIK